MCCGMMCECVEFGDVCGCVCVCVCWGGVMEWWRRARRRGGGGERRSGDGVSGCCGV